MARRPLTVAETVAFTRAADRLLSDDERFRLLDHVARDPTCGDLIPETGGVRKLRWAIRGRGKRGGARVIFYYLDDDVPVLMLDIFGKNERADLSAADRTTLRALTAQVKRRRRQ